MIINKNVFHIYLLIVFYNAVAFKHITKFVGL